LKAGKFLSVGRNQDQNYSRDAALIALAQARGQIAGRDEQPRADKLIEGELEGLIAARNLKLPPSSFEEAPATSSKRAGRGGVSEWRLLVGLGALVPVAAIALAWHFYHRQVDEVSSTSSIPKNLAVKSASLVKAATEKDAVTPQKSPQERQNTVTEFPSIASSRSEPAQTVASMARQLADAEQKIDDLRAQQAQILLDNSELDKHIKEAQELARSNAELIKDLKAAQSQMAQDNASLAAQLGASQEQVATLASKLDISQTQVAKIAAQIKASQDQIARLVERKQRSKPLVSASPPTNGPTNRPALKPPPIPSQGPAGTQRLGGSSSIGRAEQQ
jgi:hypothetical protein